MLHAALHIVCNVESVARAARYARRQEGARVAGSSLVGWGTVPLRTSAIADVCWRD